VTDVPEGPTVGSKVRVAAPGVVNVATPVSPVVPVTVTVYSPLVPEATVNEPDIAVPAIVQSGFEIKPAGDDVIVQPVSPTAKFVPVTRTFVPARPESGNRDSPAVTVKSAVPKSTFTGPAVCPQTVTVDAPGTTVLRTSNEPVMVPPEIEQGAPVGTAGPSISQSVSVGLNPVPVTEIDAPLGPKVGDRVTTWGTMFRVAVANTGVVSVTVIVSLALVNVTRTIKEEPYNV
jgi:hypothetical protein